MVKTTRTNEPPAWDDDTDTSTGDVQQNVELSRTGPYNDPEPHRHAVWNDDTQQWEEVDSTDWTRTGQVVDSQWDPANQQEAEGVMNLAIQEPTFDIENPPRGWTVTELGPREGYTVSHDGINDDGTVSAGCSFKVSKLDQVALAIEHKGRIPDQTALEATDKDGYRSDGNYRSDDNYRSAGTRRSDDDDYRSQRSGGLRTR